MSIHEGHRLRLKERFLSEGLDGFSEIQVLELALFYCIPRKDTNPIAHALLDHFGGLSQVLEAPVEELKRVPGMGESSAAYLHMITEVGRYYMVHRSTQTSVLPTLEQCAEYMVPFFLGRRVETIFLLCLDAKCKVLCCKEVGEGSVNSAESPCARSWRSHWEPVPPVRCWRTIIPAGSRCPRMRISRPHAGSRWLCQPWRSPWRITLW